MSDLPVVGAQLSVLDLARHRDWLFDKNRDLELPEFCMADILASPGPFIDMAKAALVGWQGRLGIHGPFAGFELDVKDRDLRPIVQARIDAALDVCAALGAVQMVLHSPYDRWDQCNLDNTTHARAARVSAILDTLGPALARAEDQGVQIVLENIKDTDPEDRHAAVVAAASPALALSVDTGHAHWAHCVAGAPPADRFLTAAGSDLGHVHLQDSDGWADRHWALGEGNISWPAIFRALAAVDAAPHLIIEINDFDQVAHSVTHLEALGLAQ
ncbi:TIM barrel protein [Aliiroseovarius subalbicans]|uniref:sugar phosphate isomerase/epimerase family protein n=1 Tax=Aliiroseovarius subalbicans TaxID=2925840 RepID=UPI001F56E03C|nr:TIM barrel protein [Aliiroseovarius subalbicans]MCI2399206.1 sugar phosphate isomerase/epimerase [Aliiroseovarius subalbicans]